MGRCSVRGEWAVNGVAYEKLYEALHLYFDVLVLSPAVFEHLW